MLLNCYFRPPCNSAMFQIWETLLQEVELDSQAHSDISASLARQVSLVHIYCNLSDVKNVYWECKCNDDD